MIYETMHTKCSLLLVLVQVACASVPSVRASSHPTRAVELPNGKPVWINAELQIIDIAPNTYVATHVPFHSSNILIAKMPDGTVIFCSSPFETEATRELVKWVKDVLKPTQMMAINTHFHLDGTGGNEAYAQLGVTTYASDLTQQWFKDRGARVQQGAAEGFTDPEHRRRILEMKLTQAMRSFPSQAGLDWSFVGESVEVRYPGAAHAPDNVVVFFPQRGVLFGGCMIKTSSDIGYTGHADLNHWPAAVDKVRALKPRVVVPGHGSVAGPELFDITLRAVELAQRAQ